MAVFLWNWYIHTAYHIDNHWLNRYEWFRKDKHLHMLHHDNAKINYGVVSHFTDMLMGTYSNTYSSKHDSEKMIC